MNTLPLAVCNMGGRGEISILDGQFAAHVFRAATARN
jgi:hypothetical protein